GTRIIEPNPQITKSADAEDGTIHAQDEVTYTLEAWNANGHPTSFDTVVVDCVPAGLEVQTPVTAPTGTTVDVSTTASDCAGTLITWDIGHLAAQGATPGSDEITSRLTLEYTVVIDAEAGAGVQYDNTATITGFSVPEEPTNPGDYRR